MKTGKLSKEQMLRELQAYIKICFMMTEHLTFAELATATGLHVSTLYRLALGEFTLATRYGTVQTLGDAAGIRLTFDRKSGKAKLRMVG